MSEKKLVKERQELKKKERKLTKDIAQKITVLESLNGKLRDSKKEKREVIKDSYDSDKVKALNEEIRNLNKRIIEIRRAQKRRRSLLGKVRVNIKTNLKKIKLSRKPKIIDLKLNFRPMTEQGGVDKVIGHYTAGPRDKDTKDAIRLCKIYHQAHLNNGWSGEGYALCFTSDGNILILRPAKYVGAHTLGYNTGSYGIMMHGTTGDKPTKAQKRALRWWAENGHKAIMKNGRTKTKPKDLKWYGHNDFNPTSCPGEFKKTYLSKGKV
jgi:hypothetical protein